MLRSTFSFLLLAGVSLQTCPIGYTDAGNGVCQTGTLYVNSQMLAYRNCSVNNGHLPIIENGFDNSMLRSAPGMNGLTTLWLGLTCANKSALSCLWDNGVPITSSLSSFTNFARGQPDPNHGACVIINQTDGLWYSQYCSDAYSNYICQITPGTKVTQCPERTYHYQGKCYYPTLKDIYNQGDATCRATGGRVASVHSLGESNYVMEIANFYNDHYTTFVGLACTSGSCEWSDGSPVDYKSPNFMQNLGTCTAQSGLYWVGTACNEKYVSVCKQDPSSTTSPTETPGQHAIQKLRGARGN